MVTKFDVKSLFSDLQTSKMEVFSSFQKFVDSNYASVLRQLNNFNGTDCS